MSAATPSDALSRLTARLTAAANIAVKVAHALPPADMSGGWLGASRCGVLLREGARAHEIGEGAIAHEIGEGAIAVIICQLICQPPACIRCLQPSQGRPILRLHVQIPPGGHSNGPQRGAAMGLKEGIRRDPSGGGWHNEATARVGS